MRTRLFSSSLLGFAIWLLCGEVAAQQHLEEESSGWSVEQVLEGLAQNHQPEVRFEETAFSRLLAEPLKSRGILRFTRPATLEKHITAPEDERYLIEGDKVLVVSKQRHMTLSLREYPVLQAFVDGLRATLGGDATMLKRYYAVTLEGRPQRWMLILTPLDKTMRDVVASIRFSGEGQRLKRIETLAPDGDRSVMVIASASQ